MKNNYTFQNKQKIANRVILSLPFRQLKKSPWFKQAADSCICFCMRSAAPGRVVDADHEYSGTRKEVVGKGENNLFQTSETCHLHMLATWVSASSLKCRCNVGSEVLSVDIKIFITLKSVDLCHILRGSLTIFC